MPDVFLIYAREDTERAAQIVTVLETLKWDVFWDRKLEPGSVWDTVLEEQLRTATVALVLWSEASVESEHVKDEAHASGDRLVPARLDAAELPYRYQRRQTADLTMWQPGHWHPEWEQLMEMLSRRITRAAALPSRVSGLWIERKHHTVESEGTFSLVEISVEDDGAPRIRGRSYGRSGEPAAEWPTEFDEYYDPPEKRVLYHAWDAQYGPRGKYGALGVTKMEFDPDYQTGRGYFIVDGDVDEHIEQGRITFELTRATPEHLESAGLPGGLTLDDREGCARLVAALLASR